MKRQARPGCRPGWTAGSPCWRRSRGAPPTSRSPSCCPPAGRCSSRRSASCRPAPSSHSLPTPAKRSARPAGGRWAGCGDAGTPGGHRAARGVQLRPVLPAARRRRVPTARRRRGRGRRPAAVAGRRADRLIAGRRPRTTDVTVGVVAAVGVALVVVRPGAGFDPVGVVAAVAANVSFAAGVVLIKHFPAPANPLAATGWQLLLAACRSSRSPWSSKAARHR